MSLFFNLMHDLQRPQKFEHSHNLYWRDPHIAKHILIGHLDPLNDMASRNFTFINKSVDFIERKARKHDCQSIVDYGCGPGLYAERLAHKGFNMTGIDFSNHSIQYAKRSAKNKGLSITYRDENYLDVTDKDKYDCATLIYCDYGSLPSEQRAKLLNNIWRSLKCDGIFLLDVLTVHKYYNFIEKQNWIRRHDGGMWSPKAHIEFIQNIKYDDYIALEQTTIMTKERVETHYRWFQFFTKQMIINELEKAGFTILTVYNDVAGSDYTDGNETMALLVKK